LFNRDRSLRDEFRAVSTGLQVWLIADIGLEGSFEDPSKTRLGS
jgi:hypothetical protein